MIHALGVDITHLAGTVDWTRMRSAGVTFAFVKASDWDKSINPRFNEYWRGAEDAGILRGAYHRFLASPTSPHQDPQAQASWLHRFAPPGELPHAVLLDLQDPPAECLVLLRVFLMELESFSGKRPLVRTDYAGWTRILQAGGTRMPGPGQSTWARDYPLWVVDDTARSPRVPVPWGALRWAFWQFSTRGRGGKYGVQSQYINLNLYNGGESALKGGACWQEK